MSDTNLNPSKKFLLLLDSVADLGFLSQIPDPDFSILDLRSRMQTQQHQRRRKKISCPTFFVAKDIRKLKLIFYELVKKKSGPIYKELQNFLPNNLSLSSHKYGLGSGIRDPRSGKKPILDPGSRGHKGIGSANTASRLCWHFFAFNMWEQGQEYGEDLFFPVVSRKRDNKYKKERKTS